MKVLIGHGYTRTKKLTEDYMSGRLADMKGVGEKTLKAVYAWIVINKKQNEKRRKKNGNNEE